MRDVSPENLRSDSGEVKLPSGFNLNSGNFYLSPAAAQFAGQVKLAPHISQLESLLDIYTGENFILSAGLGSGKSTLLPLLAMKMGYQSVDVLLPTKDPATSTPSFLASLFDQELGRNFGYQAGRQAISQGSSFKGEPFCCYKTYGKANLAELMRLIERPENWSTPRCVIADECHDPSDLVTSAIAWITRQIELGAPIRLVLSSGTCDFNSLSERTGIQRVLDYQFDNSNVEIVHPQLSLVDEAVKYLKQGKIVGVFETGVAECEKTLRQIVKKIGGTLPDFKYISLNSGTDFAERSELFNLPADHRGPVLVVATDCIQASVNLPFDVILDSGRCKRPFSDSQGLSVLRKELVSVVELKQRMARSGRFVERGPGVYMLFGKAEGRPLTPTADADRVAPLQFFLRAKLLGERIDDQTELRLIRPVQNERVRECEVLAEKIGALNADGSISKYGEALAKRPINPIYGVLIDHVTQRYYLIDHPSFTLTAAQEFAAELALLLDKGGIVHRDRKKLQNWVEYVNQHNDSDPIAQLELWRIARQCGVRERAQLGIHPIFYENIVEQREALFDSIGLPGDDKLELLPEIKSLLKDSLLDMCGAGFDLFINRSGYWYRLNDRTPYLPHHITVTNLGHEYRGDILLARPMAIQGHEFLVNTTVYGRSEIAKRYPAILEDLSELQVPVRVREKSNYRVLPKYPQLMFFKLVSGVNDGELVVQQSARQIDILNRLKVYGIEHVNELAKINLSLTAESDLEQIAELVVQLMATELKSGVWKVNALAQVSDLLPDRMKIIEMYGSTVVRILDAAKVESAVLNQAAIGHVVGKLEGFILKFEESLVEGNRYQKLDSLDLAQRNKISSLYGLLARLYCHYQVEDNEAKVLEYAKAHLKIWKLDIEGTSEDEIRSDLVYGSSHFCSSPGDATRHRALAKSYALWKSYSR